MRNPNIDLRRKIAPAGPRKGGCSHGGRNRRRAREDRAAAGHAPGQARPPRLRPDPQPGARGAANPPAEGGDVYSEYLRAKAAADQTLAASGLAYTIVRPGRLTDDPPTGQVQVGEPLDRAEIPRADVAVVLAAALEADNTIGKTFDVVSGETSVTRAVSAI